MCCVSFRDPNGRLGSVTTAVIPCLRLASMHWSLLDGLLEGIEAGATSDPGMPSDGNRRNLPCEGGKGAGMATGEGEHYGAVMRLDGG